MTWPLEGQHIRMMQGSCTGCVFSVHPLCVYLSPLYENRKGKRSYKELVCWLYRCLRYFAMMYKIRNISMEHMVPRRMSCSRDFSLSPEGFCRHFHWLGCTPNL